MSWRRKELMRKARAAGDGYKQDIFYKKTESLQNYQIETTRL